MENKIINCPFCNSPDLSMKKIEENVEKIDRTVSGIFDVYVCNKCNEEFFNNWDLIIKNNNRDSNIL